MLMFVLDSESGRRWKARQFALGWLLSRPASELICPTDDLIHMSYLANSMSEIGKHDHCNLPSYQRFQVNDGFSLIHHLSVWKHCKFNRIVVSICWYTLWVKKSPTILFVKNRAAGWLKISILVNLEINRKKKTDSGYQLPTTAQVIRSREKQLYLKRSVQLRSSLQLLQVQPVV